MKIAYLILAHNDAAQLKRLVDALGPDCGIFIHIDRKVDEKPFKKLITNENVVFCEKRIYVYWAGFSIVRVYLELMKNAFVSKQQYERFILLTGLDYPIMTNKEIIETFENNKDVEYVLAYNCTNSPILTDKNKLEKIWVHDLPPIRNKFIYKSIIGVLHRFFFRVWPFKRDYRVLLGGKKVDIYFGQMLSAFTREGAKLLIDTYENDKAYNKYMRYVHAPDEEYWQTIIFNSQLRSRAVMKGAEHPITEHFGWAPLHKHNYDTICKIYTEENYNEIINSGYMFFRKVTSEYSTSLLNLIDEYRKKIK